jgi:carboxymethylenebutenolidase
MTMKAHSIKLLHSARVASALPAALLALCIPLITQSRAQAQGGLDKNATPVLEVRDSFNSGGTTIQVRRFQRNEKSPQPAVILLHGCDGWQQLCAYSSISKMLAEKGYVVIVIRYFDRIGTPDEVPAADKAEFVRWLKGEATGEKQKEARRHFDAWLATVTDAVAYARGLPHVEKHSIALAGFSLGGYLAVSAAANPQLQVSAVVELFGGLPEEIRPKVQTMPPTLILHGELDDIVSVKEAHALFGLLSLKGQCVEAKIYPGVGHAFIPPGKEEPDYFKVMDAVSRTTKFLGDHMKKEVAQK